MKVTTIKVPVPLRDRINDNAHKQGSTASAFIESLINEHEQRQRMEAFGRAMASVTPDYWQEFHEWDAAVSDTRDDD